MTATAAPAQGTAPNRRARSRAWQVWVCAAAAIAVFASAADAGAAGARSSRSSRRTNPRTGRMTPAQSELVKAHKRGDRAALARVADRMGLVRLGEAIASTEPGVGEAALAAAPLARGGVLLTGAATEQIATSDWARAAAAAGTLGALLDGAVPSGIEEWDVPADVVTRACTALRALAWRSDAAVATRLAALDAVAAAAPTCGRGADLAPLARDNVPAVRRAALMVAASGPDREALLRDAIADIDRSVSTAGTATACRAEGRTRPGGKIDPPSEQALAAARAQAVAATTPPEDAVDMLDCLAASGSAQDKALLEELQRRPPAPLRDRAGELSARPSGAAPAPPGKP